MITKMEITTISTHRPREQLCENGRSRCEPAASEAARGEALCAPDATSLLYVWLSPSFPVGSFAFSHGLEWAVHDGQIHDAATTAEWIGALLEHGSLRNDVIIAAAAWNAVRAEDDGALAEIADLSLALAGCQERYSETSVQGSAFIAALKSAWTTPRVASACEALGRDDVSYPVALAIGAAGHGISRSAMLDAFALALVQNLVSATIRLSVLGQTDGQRVIAALMPVVRQLAGSANSATLDDLGAAAFCSDIAAIRHETQRTRLFRS